MPKIDLNQLEYEYNLELKEAVQECLKRDPNNQELKEQLSEINQELKVLKPSQSPADEYCAGINLKYCNYFEVPFITT